MSKLQKRGCPDPKRVQICAKGPIVYLRAAFQMEVTRTGICDVGQLLFFLKNMQQCVFLKIWKVSTYVHPSAQMENSSLLTRYRRERELSSLYIKMKNPGKISFAYILCI